MEDIIIKTKNILHYFDPENKLKVDHKKELSELISELKTHLNEENDTITKLLIILNRPLINKKIKGQIVSMTNEVIILAENSNKQNELKKLVKKKVVKSNQFKDIKVNEISNNPEQISKISSTDNNEKQIIKDKHNEIKFVQSNDLEQVNKVLNSTDNDNKQVAKVNKKIVKSIQSNDLALEHIEKLLDIEIDSYNKYTEHKPMMGISWSDKRKKWLLQNKNQNIFSYCDDLNELVIKSCELLCNKNQNKKQYKILNTDAIVNIPYKQRNILIYNSVKQPLFDIQHILKLLDLVDTNKKYNQFKDQITHYGFKKNEYCGYILKEFISEEIMYQIVLSSTSEFSKSFKNDISKLLVELRKKNGLVIENNQLKINSDYSNSESLCDNNIKKELDLVVEDSETNRSYNNPYYYSMVKDLVKNGSNIIIQKYNHHHVMYFFIMTLRDKSGLNRIFCKIGYTADIIERIRSLRLEYKCSVYLIGLKTIKNEQFEKEFHKLIKRMKSHLSCPIKINNTNKDEIYIFDEHLYREFTTIKEDIELDNINEIDDSIQCLIKDQYNFFIRYIYEECGRNLINIIATIDNFNEYQRDSINCYIEHNTKINITDLKFIDKEKQRTHDMVIVRENNKKDIQMKEMDLQMKKIELDMLKFKHIK